MKKGYGLVREATGSSKKVAGMDICDKLINLLAGWLYRWTIQDRVGGGDGVISSWRRLMSRWKGSGAAACRTSMILRWLARN
jgi:hypothetical protein